MSAISVKMNFGSEGFLFNIYDFEREQMRIRGIYNASKDVEVTPVDRCLLKTYSEMIAQQKSIVRERIFCNRDIPFSSSSRLDLNNNFNLNFPKFESNIPSHDWSKGKSKGKSKFYGSLCLVDPLTSRANQKTNIAYHGRPKLYPKKDLPGNANGLSNANLYKEVDFDEPSTNNNRYKVICVINFTSNHAQSLIFFTLIYSFICLFSD